MTRNRLSTSLLCALFLPWFAAAGRAQVTYHVTADTVPLLGTTGNLDLQFNPAGIGSLGAGVAITNFLTDGRVAEMSTNTGGAAGTLPGLVSLANSSGFNDVFQGIVFGSAFSFDATFTGPALSPSPPLPLFGSVFALSLYDAAGTTSLLTTAADGSLLHIDLAANGATSAARFPDAGGIFRATATLAPPVDVPEPSSAALLASSLAVVLRCLRGRQKRLRPAASP